MITGTAPVSEIGPPPPLGAAQINGWAFTDQILCPGCACNAP
ncbi:hypothetical protein [Rhodococcus sp. USK13]|nr:hypothetical protein [Rhodococcus sp. USK13]